MEVNKDYTKIFHLEAALAQSQEAGDRFFVLSVVPGAAVSAPSPSVSQPVSNRKFYFPIIVQESVQKINQHFF